MVVAMEVVVKERRKTSKRLRLSNAKQPFFSALLLPPRLIITSGIQVCGFDNVVERIARVAMVINRGPRLDSVDADSGTSQCAYYRVRYRPVLVLDVIRVQEGDVRPVVGQQ